MVNKKTTKTKKITNKQAVQFNTVKETAKNLEKNKTTKIDLNAGIRTPKKKEKNGDDNKLVTISVTPLDERNRQILFKATNDLRNAIIVATGLNSCKSFQQYFEKVLIADVNKTLKSNNVTQADFEDLLDKYFPKERGFKSKF